MSQSKRESIYEAIASIRLIDPHTHINPHNPASNTLADLLGYHYYTELAHSAGMPKPQIEEKGLPPRELVHRLVSNLAPLENTAQYRWLVEICRMFFGFDGDRIDASNWESLYDAAETQMRSAQWPQMVLDQSNVEAVFLTNDFDDALSGFDTDVYIPCLRTDDLVFHLSKPSTQQRLAACTGIELDGSLRNLRQSLEQRFEHFVSAGARACAISLPPTFAPTRVSEGRATTAIDEVLRRGTQADPAHLAVLSRHVFWTLAELCDQYGLPFDLMIGVNRGVYAEGVYQGQDLYDSRVSLIQYRELFNAFPAVKFPVSVLASVTNQELVSYAWIFPNVITNGHWWYSNTPSFIARDALARLEAVPQTKQIAYYSDAYKLEFVWPKFDMYRRVLAGILADHFMDGCGWSEERAIALGRQVLRDNVDELFPRPAKPETAPRVDPQAETWSDERLADEQAATDSPSTWIDPATAGSSAALAAGAIGMVEVGHPGEPAGEASDQASPPAGDENANDFSTIIPGSDETPQPPSSPRADNETISIETVADAPTSAETVRISEVEDHGDDGELPDYPTTVDSEETVRIDEELDPLPSADEVQEVEVQDVELDDYGSERVLDAESIDEQADPEPLDVGDLLGDDDQDRDDQAVAESGGAGIQLLRGEESFEPDEDSLRLQPDPLTGELTFPVASAEPDQAVQQSDDDQGDDLQLEWAPSSDDGGDSFFDASDSEESSLEFDDDDIDFSESLDESDDFDTEEKP